MKFTKKTSLVLLIVSLWQGSVFAQDVMTIDSTGTVSGETTQVQPVTATANDTLKPFKRYKAEGVSAVVGDYVVLDSDIDKSYVELKQQGISTEDITRCQLLGKLLEDKLYAHHAKIDSIMVPDAEINQQIEQQMSYMITELGSEEKVASFYRKDNISEVRKELFEVNKTVRLAGEMQRKVVDEIEITPEEIRSFFYDIPEDERPVFSAEVEVAQIVVEPEITEAAKQDVMDRLAQMRQDVIENGTSFSTKAVLYSKDPGSASKGGLIPGVKRDTPFAKEFKDQAFSLLEGEISEPFETEFGFHILMVEKIRGQELDVRHVLLFPEVSQTTIDKAEAEIKDIRRQIVEEEITFKEAAQKFSDDKETRNNGGQLINPTTFDTRFDLTKMDPVLSAQVYNLEEGELSKVQTDRDYTGKSKFKILTITQRYKEHKADYVKDYEKVKDLALKQKQIKAIETWQNKKIQETYVNINEDYNDCEFSSNWLKNQ